MRRKKSQEKRIAQERVEILFELAEKEALKRNWARAGRYVELARTMGMRYNVPPGSAIRRRFCRSCGVFLLPSVTARIRIGDGKVTYTCLKCNRVNRFPYLREMKLRRRSKALGDRDKRDATEEASVEDF